MSSSFKRMQQRAVNEGSANVLRWLIVSFGKRFDNLTFMILWAVFFAWVPSFVGKWLRALYLKLWLKHCGRSLSVSTGVLIEYPRNMIIGDYVWIGRGAHLDASGGITIGNDCMIAFQCVLQTAGHSVIPGTPYRLTKRVLGPINIGDNVWLGARTMVRYNVSIGANSVVGMGAVVVKDVPENVSVAGVPARVITNSSLAQEQR